MLRTFLIALAVQATVATDYGTPSCVLDCLNGGYCTFLQKDPSSLEMEAVNGNLIQRCVCPPQFTGVGCEIPVTECSVETRRTCHNGMPCVQLEDGEYACDCDKASLVSRFAGYMCHDPATEYCGDGIITARSFCTNGGKCLSGLTGAEKYSETSISSIPFQHIGCKCPPEFEGDHCEYLLGHTPLARVQSSQADSERSSKAAKAVGATFGSIAGLLLIVLLISSIVVRRKRQNKRILFWSNVDTFLVREHDLQLSEDHGAEGTSAGGQPLEERPNANMEMFVDVPIDAGSGYDDSTFDEFEHESFRID